jgi:predicted HicB family RNase H-like nuclease
VSVNALDRINLRLSPEMFESIDSLRAKRPGNVSRNTWIAEAIEERLAREAVNMESESTDRVAHG